MDDPDTKRKDYVLTKLEYLMERIYDIADESGLDPMFVVWLMTERIVVSAVDRYNYDPQQVLFTIKMALERDEMQDIEPRVMH
tara:strand:+ start:719 stop:967 length:249 start_codon:yes stop_codon:yes gene_type:complete